MPKMAQNVDIDKNERKNEHDTLHLHQYNDTIESKLILSLGMSSDPLGSP